MFGSKIKTRRKAGIGPAVLAAVAIAASSGWSAVPQTGKVVRHPRPSDPLAARVDWAWNEAKGEALKNGCWIGFSIKRLMSEYSFMGTFDASRFGRDVTLEETIYGKRTPTEKYVSEDRALRTAAESALKNADGRPDPGKKAVKEIAVLMKFKPSAARALERIHVSNMTLAVDLKDLPLFWLGPAETQESADFLKDYYEKAGSADIKEDLLHAVSIHQNPDVVIPFLEKILNGGEPADMKEDAAVFLGEQDDPRALAVLKKVVASDFPVEVRKHAVWGLNEMSLPAAEDLLIDLALNAKDREIREDAVQTLAEKATRKAVAALDKIVFDDKETEIQKHAVFAFAELPGKDGLPYLIKIAKTPPQSRGAKGGRLRPRRGQRPRGRQGSDRHRQGEISPVVPVNRPVEKKNQGMGVRPPI